ncbi:MAG: hypothetical protein H6599_00955 [Flavobacteriales bacterium]|nr:hypothetical protein [Flavobacteriales bacterium]
MAKATSILNLNGKLDNVVIYQLNGVTVVRKKAEGFGKLIKENAAFEGQRNRNFYLQFANSWSTAIYRMAKELAYKINYRMQNKMNGMIYHAIKFEELEKFDGIKVRKALSGLSLNFRDTLPIVDVFMDGQDVLVSCNRMLDGPVQVSLLIGTLPAVKQVKGVPKVTYDMADVEVMELTLQKEDHLQAYRINLGLANDQLVVAIVRVIGEDRNVEWVRVV